MINNICVCGAGTMGSGIAQTAAMSGIPTLLYDLDEPTLDRARISIETSLQTLVEKKKLLPAEQQNILGRIRYSNRPEECIAALIIEAIIEKHEPKLALFHQLDGFNDEDTIFATNTSSLSVTDLAEKIPHPGRVAGMHFFNPAPLMRLVEVVYTPLTDEDTTQRLMNLARHMGKTPVLCKDAPGFIVNHVARPYYLEALRLLEQGLAGIETIDTLMEASGFKMGPFRLMDLIGNDINYAVSCSVYEALGQPARLQPSPIQEQKVREGKLGKKAGEGYYTYF